MTWRAQLAAIRAMMAAVDQMPVYAGGSIRANLLAPDTHPRALPRPEQWRQAARCADAGLYATAAEWVVAATSESGIAHFLPEQE